MRKNFTYIIAETQSSMRSTSRK